MDEGRRTGGCTCPARLGCPRLHEKRGDTYWCVSARAGPSSVHANTRDMQKRLTWTEPEEEWRAITVPSPCKRRCTTASGLDASC
jgi:hypothetical protein